MLRVRSLGIQFCLILTLLLGSFSVSYALLTSYELRRVRSFSPPDATRKP